jgi:hypothetical protein
LSMHLPHRYVGTCGDLPVCRPAIKCSGLVQCLFYLFDLVGDIDRKY